MPFTNPAAGAWPSTAAVRAGSAGAREGRDSCCRCQALACVVKLPLMHDGKCQAAPPERHPHRAFPNGPSRGPGARKPLTLFPLPSCAACPGRATRRLAARRGGKQLLLAGDVGMPPGYLRGLCSGRGGAQIAFEPPILTEGLRWRAFSQFDAYHHVLWTTATSVGQAGASPSQCARGLVTRRTPRQQQSAGEPQRVARACCNGIGNEPKRRPRPLAPPRHALSLKVEAIEIHHLVPRSHEVTHELLLRVVICVDFREGSELGVRAEDEVDGGAGPLDLARRAIATLVHVLIRADGFHSVLMSSRFTKKSLVNVPGRLVKTPCSDCPELAFRARMPPTSTVISGAVNFSKNARSTSSVSGGSSSPARR